MTVLYIDLNLVLCLESANGGFRRPCFLVYRRTELGPTLQHPTSPSTNLNLVVTKVTVTRAVSYECPAPNQLRTLTLETQIFTSGCEPGISAPAGPTQAKLWPVEGEQA